MKSKLAAGSVFPTFTLPSISNETIVMGKARENFDWQLIIIYRGKHCPICTQYLKSLNEQVDLLNQEKIDVVVASADSKTQATEQMLDVEPKFDVTYGLTIENMRALGLYISQPRSEKETDHDFAEPGVFVVNHIGQTQLIDISNAPFLRPPIESILRGLRFIRDPEKNYPIRGTK